MSGAAQQFGRISYPALRKKYEDHRRAQADAMSLGRIDEYKEHQDWIDRSNVANPKFMKTISRVAASGIKGSERLRWLTDGGFDQHLQKNGIQTHELKNPGYEAYWIARNVPKVLAGAAVAAHTGQTEGLGLSGSAKLEVYQQTARQPVPVREALTEVVGTGLSSVLEATRLATSKPEDYKFTSSDARQAASTIMGVTRVFDDAALSSQFVADYSGVAAGSVGSIAGSTPAAAVTAATVGSRLVSMAKTMHGLERVSPGAMKVVADSIGTDRDLHSRFAENPAETASAILTKHKFDMQAEIDNIGLDGKKIYDDEEMGESRRQSTAVLQTTLGLKSTTGEDTKLTQQYTWKNKRLDYETKGKNAYALLSAIEYGFSKDLLSAEVAEYVNGLYEINMDEGDVTYYRERAGAQQVNTNRKYLLQGLTENHPTVISSGVPAALSARYNAARALGAAEGSDRLGILELNQARDQAWDTIGGEMRTAARTVQKALNRTNAGPYRNAKGVSQALNTSVTVGTVTKTVGELVAKSPAMREKLAEWFEGGSAQAAASGLLLGMPVAGPFSKAELFGIIKAASGYDISTGTVKLGVAEMDATDTTDFTEMIPLPEGGERKVDLRNLTGFEHRLLHAKALPEGQARDDAIRTVLAIEKATNTVEDRDTGREASTQTAVRNMKYVKPKIRGLIAKTPAGYAALSRAETAKAVHQFKMTEAAKIHMEKAYAEVNKLAIAEIKESGIVSAGTRAQLSALAEKMGMAASVQVVPEVNK